MEKIILLQLGSPKSPSVADVRQYLQRFLSHPKVVRVNPYLWKVILHLFILPFRSKKSAQKYLSIWNDGFPLVKYTHSLTAKIQNLLPDKKIECQFILDSDFVFDSTAYYLPLFPQYSHTTTGLLLDYPAKLIMNDFCNADFFLINSVRKIKAQGDYDAVIISFHGLPWKQILETNDPYYQQCLQTFDGIKKLLPEHDLHLAFQSRFLNGKWTTPYIQDVVKQLAHDGKKNIGVYCASFVADCLETLEEIEYELKFEMLEYGVDLSLIPCLNDDDEFARDLSLLF